MTARERSAPLNPASEALGSKMCLKALHLSLPLLPDIQATTCVRRLSVLLTPILITEDARVCAKTEKTTVLNFASPCNVQCTGGYILDYIRTQVQPEFPLPGVLTI